MSPSFACSSSCRLVPLFERSRLHGDFVYRIYPIELEIKDTTDTDRSAAYLDLHLEIDSEGWLRTKKEMISFFPL